MWADAQAMKTITTRLRDVRIYPFYRNIPIEVEPVLHADEAEYCTGHLLSNAFFALSLEAGEVSEVLQPGATYSCVGVNDAGVAIQTHWFFCTSVGPTAQFGVSQNCTRRNAFTPLLHGTSAPLIRLEKLVDLVAVFPSPPPAHCHAQAQIGRHGWLISTAYAAPHVMGVLIEDPALPPHFAEGAENIMITAKCSRTMQTISLDALICASAGRQAVFLERVL